MDSSSSPSSNDHGELVLFDMAESSPGSVDNASFPNIVFELESSPEGNIQQLAHVNEELSASSSEGPERKRRRLESCEIPQEESSDPSYTPSTITSTSSDSDSIILSLRDYEADYGFEAKDFDHVLGRHHQLKRNAASMSCCECIHRSRIVKNRRKCRNTNYKCDVCDVPICSSSHLQLYHNRNGNPELSSPPVSSRTRSRRARYLTNITEVGSDQDEQETARDFLSDTERDLDDDLEREIELDLPGLSGPRREDSFIYSSSSSEPVNVHLPRRRRRLAAARHSRGGPSGYLPQRRRTEIESDSSD